MSSEDPRIGTILNDRYEIIERIGAGGMAVVYRGERLELERPVAIKFLQEVMLQYPKFITRFEAEAKAMSQLSHPYCVSVIDFGVEGAPYIVMDFAEGKTLKAHLREERFSVSRAISLTRQILAGIAHAHSHGIIHRDIKPENIMISEVTGVGEHVRIFDFGLAKLLHGGPGLQVSSPSIIAGTPNYMAPEQSRGKVVDERADLYSIGVILFEMLTGQKPFAHEDFVEVVRMHRDAPRPSLAEMSDKRQYSSSLETLIAKAMAKNPKERFQSADEFLEALNGTREGSQTKDAISPKDEQAAAETMPIGKTFSDVPTMYMESGSYASAIRKRLRKSKKLLLGTLLLVVAAVVGIGLVSSGEDDGPSPPQKADKQGATGTPKTKKSTKKAAETERANAAQTGDNGKAGTAPADGPTQAPVPEGPRPVKNMKDVRELIDAGKLDAAIDGLRKLRRDNPKNAYYVLMMANLFFEKTWWGDALEHYQEALRLAPSYKTRTDINKNLIAMLEGKKIYRKVAALIQRDIGRSALLYLRRASKRDSNPVIRKRAAQLIKRIRR